MKRLLYALTVLTAFAGAALGVVSTTVVNNTSYTLLASDVRVITGPTAFTASRTWTLASAGASCIGAINCPDRLEITDNGNAVSVAFPLVISPASGETINGVTTPLTITAAGSRVNLVPVTGSGWTAAVLPPLQTAMGGTAPTVWHSGNAFFPTVASGNDSTAVSTETYIVQVDVLVPCTITGVSWINLATSTGNVQFSLADSTGTVITAAQTASTAAGIGAVYQQVPFATPYVARPGKYFILMQNSAANHYRAHTIGNFGASKKTGEVFGTFTNVTPPTTFTTNLGPIADLY